jgi:hypothetical protein
MSELRPELLSKKENQGTLVISYHYSSRAQDQSPHGLASLLFSRRDIESIQGASKYTKKFL